MAISKQETSWNVVNPAPVSPSRQPRRPFKTGSKNAMRHAIVAAADTGLVPTAGASMGRL